MSTTGEFRCARSDSPLLRRALGNAAWHSSPIEEFELGPLGDAVYDQLIRSVPADGIEADVSRHVHHSLERLLGPDGTPREFQQTVINSLIERKNVLGVFRTGQGKSVCYQALGLALGASGHGVTLVVSPLVALQFDQLEGLQRRNIWEATVINSSLLPSVRAARLRGIAAGFYRLVYVAPEGLFSGSLRSSVTEPGLALVAIDEAHCISEMGHDFRPDYRQLPIAVRRLLGLRDDTDLAGLAIRPRLLAVTGTANPLVRKEIKDLLGGPFVEHLDTQFVRPELRFAVERVEDEPATSSGSTVEKNPRRAELLLAVMQRTKTPSIVYVSTKLEAEQLSVFLAVQLHLRVDPYHAGLSAELRRSTERDFRDDRVDIICATNAFGMGVDKANIRSVVHWRMPGSPEALYQEAGRAGRGQAGQPADCVVLYHPSDLSNAAGIMNRSVPTRAELEAVWSTLLELKQLSGGSGDVWTADQDLRALSGLRDAVDPSVCIAHLARAGLVRELSRSGAMLRSRRPVDGFVGGFSEIEQLLVDFFEGIQPAEFVPVQDVIDHVAQHGLRADAAGIRSAIRGLERRRALTATPTSAVVRTLVLDPAEATRTHLLRCHEILRFASETPNRWVTIDPGVGKVPLPLPQIIGAIETIATLGLGRVVRSHSDGRPPAIRAIEGGLVRLRSLGKAAPMILSTATGAPVAGTFSVSLDRVAEETGQSIQLVEAALLAAHHASAIMLDPQSYASPSHSAHVVRQLHIADVDVPTALDGARKMVRTRLERDQLRRLALAVYGELPNDDELDVHQPFLEQYFTDPAFLEEIREVRLNDNVCFGLDPEQLDAVTSDAPRLAIVAGAGTGKTRTLTRRIAYRTLASGTLQDQVLAVCFGKDAADEMGMRLAALGTHVRVRTLNSFGNSIVRSHWPLLGYSSEPQVINEQESKASMWRIANETAALQKAITPDSIPGHAAQISLAKSMMLGPHQLAGLPIADGRQLPPIALTALLYAEYEQRLEVANLIDFDDQFLKALAILDDHDARRHVQDTISELYIDEAQDLSPAQWELLMRVGEGARITAVGDPRQAIYSWRGADPELFTHFVHDPSTTNLPLTNNYRSGYSIITHANAVVANLGYPELGPTMNFSGSAVARQRAPGALATEVKQWIANAVPDDQIAVLGRTGAAVAAASTELRSAGIRVRELGLRPLHTTPAFTRARRLFAEIPGDVDTEDQLDFATVMQSWSERTDVVGYLNGHAQPGQEPLDDWHRLTAAMVEQARLGVTDPLDALSKIESGDRAHSDTPGGVVVTTLHQSKGLEWDAVAIVDVDDKSFRPGQLDAQLLFYVGITRARRHLTLFSDGRKATVAALAGF